MSSEPNERKSAVAGYFGTIAPGYDRVGPRLFTVIGKRLIELAEVPRGARVLDVASGRGAVLFAAAERAGKDGFATGVDIAEGMVQQTAQEIHERRIENASMQRMDAEQLEFPDASFDCVLCGFALFFLPHLDRALAEFRRVLKPGGRVGFSTWGPVDKMWGWYNELTEAYGVRRPSLTTQALDNAEDLRGVLAEAGFSPVRVVEEVFDFVYASEEEWWARLWAHGGSLDLAGLDTATLARFKADLFQSLQQHKDAEGIHRKMDVLFSVGTSQS